MAPRRWLSPFPILLAALILFDLLGPNLIRKQLGSLIPRLSNTNGVAEHALQRSTPERWYGNLDEVDPSPYDFRPRPLRTGEARTKLLFLLDFKDYLERMNSHSYELWAVFFVQSLDSWVDAAMRHPRVQSDVWGLGWAGWDESLTLSENLAARVLPGTDKPVGSMHSGPYRIIRTAAIGEWITQAAGLSMSISWETVTGPSASATFTTDLATSTVQLAIQRKLTFITHFKHPGYVLHHSHVPNKKLATYVQGHPSYKAQIRLRKEFAEGLRRAQICIFDSSIEKKAIRKYAQAFLSGCIVAGDLPTEQEEAFRNFMIPLRANAPIEEINEIVSRALLDPAELQRKALAAFAYAREHLTNVRKVDRMLHDIQSYRDGKRGALVRRDRVEEPEEVAKDGYLEVVCVLQSLAAEVFDELGNVVEQSSGNADAPGPGVDNLEIGVELKGRAPIGQGDLLLDLDERDGGGVPEAGDDDDVEAEQEAQLHTAADVASCWLSIDHAAPASACSSLQNSQEGVTSQLSQATGSNTPRDNSSEHEDDGGYPCRLRDESEVNGFKRFVMVTVNGFLPAPPEKAKGKKEPAPTKLAPY
ncbi:MAG: hypothetical protein CYPHOPRED_001599 [Cyphobasidiales sp. Tagirdzhanova-0007]|nr:MAG: hypothetical protein CYPHOPRED_001599 [Cyphobasidiales sp. Tagirdzhanova-0007]